MSGQARSAASCCPTFAAGYGVHYSNCPKHDPVEDAARLPAAEAELERRMSSAASARPAPLIGPERKRGSVTSTATTPEPCIWPRCLGAGPAVAECSEGCAHAHDTPALCDISVLSGPVARGAEVGSTSAGGTVEAASDGTRRHASPVDVVEASRGAGETVAA
jgi:hypothetical protein